MLSNKRGQVEHIIESHVEAGSLLNHQMESKDIYGTYLFIHNLASVVNFFVSHVEGKTATFIRKFSMH